METPQHMSKRFRMERQVGQGSFSTICAAYDFLRKERVALKIEKADKSKRVLLFEHNVLKSLQGSSHICKVYDFVNNSQINQQNFIVMEMLGSNLASLKKMYSPQFDRTIAIKLLIQMLDAIEGIHIKGYIHRDVKPSNFVMGTGRNKNIVYLVDFGLAKVHLNKNGAPYEPRTNAEFRGTISYASLNAHLKKDLSRRDDLWSYFFTILDFFDEPLPWRALRDNKEEVKKIKLKCLSDPKRLLFKSTTRDIKEVEEIFSYLKTLHYSDLPDYYLIRSKLTQILQREQNMTENRRDIYENISKSSSRDIFVGNGGRKRKEAEDIYREEVDMLNNGININNHDHNEIINNKMRNNKPRENNIYIYRPNKRERVPKDSPIQGIEDCRVNHYPHSTASTQQLPHPVKTDYYNCGCGCNYKECNYKEWCLTPITMASTTTPHTTNSIEWIPNKLPAGHPATVISSQQPAMHQPNPKIFIDAPNQYNNICNIIPIESWQINERSELIRGEEGGVGDVGENVKILNKYRLLMQEQMPPRSNLNQNNNMPNTPNTVLHRGQKHCCLQGKLSRNISQLPLNLHHINSNINNKFSNRAQIQGQNIQFENESTLKMNKILECVEKGNYQERRRLREKKREIKFDIIIDFEYYNEYYSELKQYEDYVRIQEQRGQKQQLKRMKDLKHLFHQFI